MTLLATTLAGLTSCGGGDDVDPGIYVLASVWQKPREPHHSYISREMKFFMVEIVDESTLRVSTNSALLRRMDQFTIGDVKDPLNTTEKYDVQEQSEAWTKGSEPKGEPFIDRAMTWAQRSEVRPYTIRDGNIIVKDKVLAKIDDGALILVNESLNGAPPKLMRMSKEDLLEDFRKRDAAVVADMAVGYKDDSKERLIAAFNQRAKDIAAGWQESINTRRRESRSPGELKAFEEVNMPRNLEYLETNLKLLDERLSYYIGQELKVPRTLVQ